MSNITHHLDQRELAERWRISPRTLERWRCTGEGPCYVKIGKRAVYRIEDIEEFERERLRGVAVNQPKKKAKR